MAGSVLHGALTEIDVPERGSKQVAGDAFRALAGSADFWRLVDAKILRIEHAGADRFDLHGIGWVGQAVIGEVTLNLTEKVSGSLAVFLGHATGDAFRVADAEASASSMGTLIRLLIHAFLDRTRLYVSRGVESAYESCEETGSMIGGALDVPKTVRLRAGGFKHMAAFSRPRLHRDLPQNRVIAAALRQVEFLAPQVELEAVDLSTARSLAQFFGDARPLEVLQGVPERWAREARRLSGDRLQSLERDLLTLAAVVLAHLSFETENRVPDRTPRSWFLSLESLFEDAVRRVLGTVSPRNISVLDGGPQRPIFSAVSGRFRAQPDLVLLDDAAVRAIGDVKYKNWAGLSTHNLHPDLYQLLAHSSAFNSNKAFLVFAHDEFESIRLGHSASGVETWAFAIDVRDLEGGLRRALAAIA
jgi:5-methylcytosine-specific restriction endonuclease McrBC regulatory subunit McrC